MAEDRLPDEQISAELGVAKKTLEMWTRREDFRAKVAGHVAALEEALRGKGIAERQNRVDALNDRWRRMQAVIHERATSYAGQAPGADTGLL